MARFGDRITLQKRNRRFTYPSALSSRETLGGAVASQREVIVLRRCREASTVRLTATRLTELDLDSLVAVGSTAQYAADAATAGNEAGLAVDHTLTT